MQNSKMINWLKHSENNIKNNQTQGLKDRIN